MEYKISELAYLLNVSTNTIRRYEKMGYIASKRSKSNYRYYNKDDITKFMTVILLRKYGFTHTEIANMENSEMPDLIAAYESKLEEMDEQINQLTNLRHRLKDDLVLLKKVNEVEERFYVRDCIDFSYVLYQSGDKLLKESKRILTVQNYLYSSPEVQLIYIIRKKDIENDKIILNMGWAVKMDHLNKYNIKENEYTERYEKQKSLFSFAKLPINTKKPIKYTNEQLKDVLLNEPFKYMQEQNLKIAGDIMGVVVTNKTKDNQEIQDVLLCIPIVNK
jgi:DNA-binding transcriptional MerR regulator